MSTLFYFLKIKIFIQNRAKFKNSLVSPLLMRVGEGRFLGSDPIKF